MFTAPKGWSMLSYQARAFREDVGRRLRDRRESLGLTQEQIAWEAGVAQGSISYYEQGKSEIPLRVLIDICRHLNVDPIEIVPSLHVSASNPDIAL